MRAEAEKRRERFEFEMEQVTIDLKLAVKKSNRDIEQRFQQTRQTQLDGGVLGQAIAQRDGLGVLTKNHGDECRQNGEQACVKTKFLRDSNRLKRPRHQTGRKINDERPKPCQEGCRNYIPLGISELTNRVCR